MIPHFAKWYVREMFGPWMSEDLMTPDDAMRCGKQMRLT
jgi:hypothetical protein